MPVWVGPVDESVVVGSRLGERVVREIRYHPSPGVLIGNHGLRAYNARNPERPITEPPRPEVPLRWARVEFVRG